MQSDQSLEGLPGYISRLLDETRERTGYPLRVVEERDIGYDSELRLARKGTPFHEIAYVPEYREYRAHFMVSAAVKALRVWEAPAHERLVPTLYLEGRLPPPDHTELQQKLFWMPAGETDKLSKFLYHGVTRQLTSMPMDIRVERDIAEQILEHRVAQHAYLRRQVKDLEPTFMPGVAEVSPERMYAASTAMNHVLAAEAADLAGVVPGPHCRRSPHQKLGRRLAQLLHAVEEPGYQGDRLLTDLWAEELGMRDFYEWVRLDDFG